MNSGQAKHETGVLDLVENPALQLGHFFFNQGFSCSCIFGQAQDPVRIARHPMQQISFILETRN